MCDYWGCQSDYMMICKVCQESKIIYIQKLKLCILGYQVSPWFLKISSKRNGDCERQFRPDRHVHAHLFQLFVSIGDIRQMEHGPVDIKLQK